MRTTGPGQSALLLLDAVEVLVREHIDYVVIGAMAASLHGIVRASVDADAVVSLVAKKPSDLERSFRSTGFQTEMKVFAGGPQDLSDAGNAIAIAGQSLDRVLVERLTKRYGRSALKNLSKLLDT